MSLTELNDQGIMWVHDPVRDTIGTIFPSEGCTPVCSTMLCRELCIGGFCITLAIGSCITL